MIQSFLFPTPVPEHHDVMPSRTMHAVAPSPAEGLLKTHLRLSDA